MTLHARVIVDLEPRHLDRTFDYLVPDDLVDVVQPGSRVEVPFAGRRRSGIVDDLSPDTEVDPAHLRPVRRILGEHAWARPDDLDLWRWAAERWGSPLAHVVRHALPKRVVAVETAAAEAGWYLQPNDDERGEPERLTAAWDAYGGASLLAALDKGRPALHWWWPLADDDPAQRLAELVRAVRRRGRGVLVLTPGPRSAVADAVSAVDPSSTADVRMAKDRAQYRAWLEARHGRARTVIGERGSAFWPVSELGLVVVEDEASPAHKEHRSPRHHVREVALERARRAGAICLLTGPVPSAALRRLLDEGRVQPLRAARRDERRSAPSVEVVAPDPVPTRLPSAALRALRAAVDAGTHGVVLASQRGEGSALVCTSCPTVARCERCEALLARSRDRSGRLACPRCGHRTRSSWRCPNCGGAELVPLSAGAEQLGKELERSLTAPVAVLQGYAPPVPDPPAVLVMTRGSVLAEPPGPVGAVVLRDLDRLAGRPRLDAAEDTLRLAMTIARWVRRSEINGTALVPALDGQHALVRALVSWDPDLFWTVETERRTPLRFPPVATIIHVDVPVDAPELPWPASLGEMAVRPIGDGRRRHQLRTDDRIQAVSHLVPVLADWSKEGITDTRVDVEPVDLD